MPGAYLTSVASGIADGGDTVWVSPSFTVSGDDKVMYVGVGNSDSSPATPINVTWDLAGVNQAVTLLSPPGGLTHGTFGNLSVWRLIAPANATGSVTVEWAAAKGERIVEVWVGTGWDQTTPNGTPVSAIDETGTPSSTVSAGAVTTTAGQLVLQFAHSIDTGTFSGPTEFDSPTGTERQDIVTSGTAYDAIAVQEQTASGSSTTPTWTMNEQPTSWASIALALNEAGAGGTSALRQMMQYHG